MSFYCVFDSEAYWGSHPKGDVSSCSCRDCSFGGVRAVDPVAAKDEPYPEGSLGAKLDALLASSGDTRKVNTTQVDNNSGFAWDAQGGANVAFISDGHYSIVVSGVAEGIEGDGQDDGLSPAERSAWALLGFYFDHNDEKATELLENMAGGLQALGGKWAFVLHDRRHHRVVAAADKENSAKLLWGETVKGNIEFSTTSDSAVDDKVDLFPGGCLFISSVGTKAYEAFVKQGCPGTLVSYANKQPAAGRGIAKVRSRGSFGDFQRVGSGVDVTLIKTYAKGMVRESPSFTDLMGIPESK